MPRTALQDAEQRRDHTRDDLSRLRRPRMQEGLDRLGTAATSRRAFNAALNGTGCTRHAARPGQPCWSIPSGYRVGTLDHRALCGPRIAVVFGSGTP